VVTVSGPSGESVVFLLDDTKPDSLFPLVRVAPHCRKNDAKTLNADLFPGLPGCG
jgi:hypothetical protein